MRKRKRHSRNGPSNWGYVTGIPRDVDEAVRRRHQPPKRPASVGARRLQYRGLCGSLPFSRSWLPRLQRRPTWICRPSYEQRFCALCQHWHRKLGRLRSRARVSSKPHSEGYQFTLHPRTGDHRSEAERHLSRGGTGDSITADKPSFVDELSDQLKGRGAVEVINASVPGTRAIRSSRSSSAISSTWFRTL